MENIEKITNYIIPTIILIVFVVGIKEKKDIFKIFIDGAEEGIKNVIKLIPIIIAFFFFSGVIISSNIINFVFNFFIKNNEIRYIITTSVIKMFSGSAGISLWIETLKKVGVDSNFGLALSVILGATETTIYVISIYLGRFKNKKIWPICILGVICDIFVLILSLSFFIDFV